MGSLIPIVSKTVRVPDPVYNRLGRESERKDVSRGAVIREWMDKAEKWEQAEATQY